ncbi:hypothetical protein N2W54_002904 [Lotmaria passim]
MGKPNQKGKKVAAVKSLRQRPTESCSVAASVDAAAHLADNAPHTHAHASPSSLPPCVQQLRESTECAVLEDACSDIAHFSLQAKHNDAFLRDGVPQRLAQLLLFASPYAAAPTINDAQRQPNSNDGGQVREAMEPNRAFLCVQIAAADALRSLVTNSEQDRVVDALTGTGMVDSASGLSFAESLAVLVREDWTRVQEARRRMTPNDWMDVYHEGNDDDNNNDEDGCAAADLTAQHASGQRKRRAGSTRNLYFTLLRHLEEVLLLVGICVEASEACAAAFSDPAALCLLIDLLRAATTTTWETLLHPSAQYYAEEGNAAAAVNETVLAMRAYKRREACLLASLAVSVSDVLLLLSPESPSLVHLVTAAAADTKSAGGAAAASPVSSSSLSSAATTLTAEQRSFLNTAVDAVDLRAWLAEKPAADVQLQEHFSDAALPSFVGPCHTVVALERERVLYDLLRATLSTQGMLLHLAPAAANLQRVLPLLCDALQKVSLPMHVWCGLLPILMDTCEVAEEEVKSAATRLATHRLRATQSAVRLLHVVVNVVGEQNDPRVSAEQDDEAAFATNPLAPLLQSGNLFYSFGLLLKDVLWMSTSSSSGDTGADVVTQQAQQRALRAEAKSNAAATELQMVLLSTEVNVWEVASTLLLMLPVASLGDPSLTWRALMLAVQHRYELHLNAAAAEQQHQHEDYDRTSQVNIVQHSASAHQLIWLQLESLVQMLWTMQRKQSKAYGGVLAARNDVQASSADVDVLVRVSWESSASAGLKQACVAAVGLLCASTQQPEAVATAARFACAVVTNGGPAATFHKKLLDAFTQLVPASVPTYPAERRLWMQQLAMVDAAATVRSEAANTLVDLFLDERYDAAVYWPLGVQEGLEAFKMQLATYVKRRAQLDKETKRKLHLSTETPDAEQWAEVLENLNGFLDYKASNKR